MSPVEPARARTRRPRSRRAAHRCAGALRFQAASLAFGAVAGLGLLGACERSPEDGAAEVPTRHAPAPLIAGWDQWTRAEARARLEEREAARSAALRLVWLSHVDALCAPRAIGATWFERLSVVEVGATSFALGFTDQREPHRLRAPVLIDDAGEIVQVADGVDEELLILHLGNTESFPHVAFTPDRVWVIEDELVLAIALKPGYRLRFDVRTEPEGEVLVLLAPVARGEIEAARFLWSPAELAFMGPAALDLPDPPGGSFEIDLRRSERFEPVGGRMPAPRQNAPPPEPGDPRGRQREV